MSLGVNPTYLRCVTNMDRFYLLMYYIGFFSAISWKNWPIVLFVAFFVIVFMEVLASLVCLSHLFALGLY